MTDLIIKKTTDPGIIGTYQDYFMVTEETDFFIAYLTDQPDDLVVFHQKGPDDYFTSWFEGLKSFRGSFAEMRRKIPEIIKDVYQPVED
jgi:hypothetical protein